MHRNWEQSGAGMGPSESARFIRDHIPADGLFFGHEWRISPTPFPISAEVAKEFDTLGRVLLQFYRTVNLLYRQSAAGMLAGFASIFGEAPGVHVVVSEEAATYRPEMAWLCQQLDSNRFKVQSAIFDAPANGDAVYRFFELFDVANEPGAHKLFALAEGKRIRLTSPPKPIFEEKMLFALLWNRHLREFWQQQLGESFFTRMLRLVPYSWILDPAPLPPHAAIPELNLSDWQQLKGLSQRERDLILKISGYSPRAWGSRGVFLGSDMSHAEWSAALEQALNSYSHSPYVLQRYHRTRLVEASYYDFEKEQLIAMPGRVRLCPYYFVIGEGDAARAQLGGVLATICPADKKLIHGMKEAILAPCSVASAGA